MVPSRECVQQGAAAASFSKVEEILGLSRGWGAGWQPSGCCHALRPRALPAAASPHVGWPPRLCEPRMLPPTEGLLCRTAHMHRPHGSCCWRCHLAQGWLPPVASKAAAPVPALCPTQLCMRQRSRHAPCCRHAPRCHVSQPRDQPGSPRSRLRRAAPAIPAAAVAVAGHRCCCAASQAQTSSRRRQRPTPMPPVQHEPSSSPTRQQHQVLTSLVADLDLVNQELLKGSNLHDLRVQ